MDNLSMQSEELEALESIYGPDWQREIDSDNSYSIQLTPQVKLFLTLNPSYPSESPPSYLLLAPCLTKTQKQEIEQSLEEIYLDNLGAPVLFQWIEKVKEVAEQDVEERRLNEEKVEEAEEKLEEIGEVYEIVHGEAFKDRKSIFQGHVCIITSEDDVRKVISQLLLNKKVAQATHNIFAYRIESPSGNIIQDFDDDGESHAGGRLLHLLQILDVKNVVVIVSRWYGGIHLGPDRFRHINNAAKQVLQLAEIIK